MSFINSLIVMLVLALPAGMADARQDAQKIEQRLTPEQLRETGLDTLTPAQLARLNELLSAPDRFGGTLRAFRRHQFADKTLANPGAQD